MKCVQGILSVPATQYEVTEDNQLKILRLLTHEATCVYSDRLVS